MVEIVKVISEKDVAEVARLAREIWTDHYTPIIGSAQVEYMLERFQSAGAITEQLKADYEYFLAVVDEKLAGYLGLVPEEAGAVMMISKIYVRRDFRGCGVGRRMLAFAESLCRQRGFGSVWLTVNKFNSDSIAWYERMGFVNAGSVVQDIGGGFVMDDYRMEKVLPKN